MNVPNLPTTASLDARQETFDDYARAYELLEELELKLSLDDLRETKTARDELKTYLSKKVDYWRI